MEEGNKRSGKETVHVMHWEPKGVLTDFGGHLEAMVQPVNLNPNPLQGF